MGDERFISYYRNYGHEVYSYPVDGDGQAYYLDNNEPVDEANPRPCPKCHQPPTPEGHDACLGEIPGACAACCGHGVERGYVAWDCGGPGLIEQAWDVKALGRTFRFSILTEVNDTEGIAVSAP